MLVPSTVAVVEGAYSGAVRQDYGMCTLLGGFLPLAWAVPVAFAALRSVTRPDTGTLNRLAQGAQEAGAGTLESTAVASLRRWRRAIMWFGVIVCFSIMLSVCIRVIPRALKQDNVPLAVAGASLIPSSFAFALVLGQWFLSLKFACAIAFDDISRIINAAAAEAGSTAVCCDAEWQARVWRPTMELADTTLPMVSEWGTSLGTRCVGCGCACLGTLYAAIVEPDPVQCVMQILTALLVSVGLFNLLSIPASVSATCMDISKALKELRKQHPDEIVAQRVDRLLDIVQGENRDRGLGFTVLGLVISTQELRFLAAKAYGLLLIGFGLLREHHSGHLRR
jgi:hypothetical protein